MDIKVKWITLFFLTFIVLVCGLSSSVWATERNIQYWNTNLVTVKLSEAWRMRLEEEFRFKDDATDFYYTHTHLDFMYSGFAKWLDAGVAYRQVFVERNKTSEWKREDRPFMIFLFKFKPGDFKLFNRSVFFYRILEDADEYWGYRNLITLKLPFKWSKFEIQPYVADEFFADFEKKELNENRLFGGADFNITKNLKGEFYYLWRRVKSGARRWIHHDVVGTNLKFIF